MGEQIGIWYRSHDGQTEKVAHRIGERLRQLGERWTVTVEPIGTGKQEPIWPTPTAMVVGASVHGGRFDGAVARFVERQRDVLGATVSAFFGLSLSEADRDEEVRGEARRLIDEWLKEARWAPDEVASIAGATPFSRYGRVKSWVMKRIIAGRDPEAEPGQDREYTDWEAVDAFADRIGERVQIGRVARPGAP